jgi:transposase-like protein
MRGTIRSGDERARLVEAYRDSGLSAKAFAEREGLPASTLYQWLAARKHPRPARLRIARVLRQAAAPQAPAATATTVVIDLGSARVHVPRGFDTGTLGAVLDLLAARACREAP